MIEAILGRGVEDAVLAQGSETQRFISTVVHSSSTTTAINTGSANAMQIGAFTGTGSNNSLNGTVSEVRFYNRAPSATEIFSVCTANKRGLAFNDDLREPFGRLIVVARGDNLAAANDDWRIPLRRVGEF